MAIDWVVVKGDNKTPEIGAVGFIGNKIVTIVAFYEDNDGNMDGKVSWTESLASWSPVNLTGGSQLVLVARSAAWQTKISTRDGSIQTIAKNLFSKFAKGLVADGIYTVYFSQGVSTVAQGIAGRVSTNMVKQFVIKQGMEKAIKDAYNAGVGY